MQRLILFVLLAAAFVYFWTAADEVPPRVIGQATPTGLLQRDKQAPFCAGLRAATQIRLTRVASANKRGGSASHLRTMLPGWAEQCDKPSPGGVREWRDKLSVVLAPSPVPARSVSPTFQVARS